MEFRKCTSFSDAPSVSMAPTSFPAKVHPKSQFEEQERVADHAVEADVDLDLREVYFLIMHFLSSGPCQRTCGHLLNELLEHKLLPRRYHGLYDKNGAISREEKDDGISLPLNYDNVAERYSHIGKDHLVKLLKQLILSASPLRTTGGRAGLSAVDVPTLLGIGPFSLLGCEKNKVNTEVKHVPVHLRWPHMQADQVRGLSLRELGGGFRKHHRAPSIRYASYAIAKPSTMVQKMQNIKKIRGHRNAVYCAIFDRSGRYVITGSDDRLVKIWSMETAFCLTSCRGHEGDITDLAVSLNNVLVASASNDYGIRVWRLPDGMPISVLRGHQGAVTAIAFSPRLSTVYQLLSSSDDGTCRIWDARYSLSPPRIYQPKPTDAIPGKINSSSSNNSEENKKILCCAYNSNGTVFVTGSSDTFARVWNAGKSSTEDTEQPNHEICILNGHENDVNYVQFSGCAVASRSSISDSLIEENLPKFKNSWYSHDYIVTCSRDGSAIIWIPRSRRSHGKVGRWTRAYHLKVPPPPMPPQPPRGGPRQRFLPTPRGVNMIVWSLDNRFVLAAIMDNRICVWNASDGSLVHSLTGHSDSTYVLDVHPFNPRIAMSAGYDGKTIIWDIWEGTPIRIYEIGPFKLIDGKFSPDGTSVVLSDNVGQIYLLNTGQGESQKDAQYDQFFLGDYRPLIQDAQGNVIDQETQLPPYRRNMQDLLCDGNLFPYPNPYQDTYQRRRLGALGIEWRPSSIKFAVGTDIGLGQEYQILPLADLDIVIEPLPDFIDAMYWELENDVINDETDSEYNITEEYSSAEERGKISNSSCSDPDGSEEDQNGLRRSKRRKSKVELMTSSGRGVKRRSLSEHDGTSSRSRRAKKLKKGPRNIRRKSHKTKPLRPQRVAARNVVNIYSSGEDEDEYEDEVEDEYESEDVSSDSGSLQQDSDTQNSEPFDSSQFVPQNNLNAERASLDESNDIIYPPQTLVANVENRKKLVLKISIGNRKKSLISENNKIECDNQDNLGSSCLRHNEEKSKEIMINLSSGNPGPSSANMISADLSENHNMTKFRDGEEIKNIENQFEPIENPKPKHRLKIKRKSLMVSNGPPNVMISSATPVSTFESDQNLVTGVLEVDERFHSDFNTTLDDGVYLTEKKSHKFKVSSSEEIGEGTSTDATRRARSLRLKATSRESNDLNKGLFSSVWTSKSADKSAKISSNQRPSDQWMSTSTRTRSTRNRGKNYYDDQSGEDRKSNWLLLSEQEEGYRYIPQLGDEVAYIRQGHQEFAESRHQREVGPWERFGDAVRAVEYCQIEELDYATIPGSGESGCKITLAFTDSSSRVFGKTFQLTLPELINFTDFMVEKTWFDAAIMRNWCCRDKCLVWWKDEGEKGGGKWYNGRIVSSKDLSSEFPGSPWQRYLVTYDKDDTGPHPHSPWELHDLSIPWDQPHIDSETRRKMLSYFANLHQSASSNKDKHGILKLKQVAEKSDFLNRFPVPLSLDIIVLRLENKYYRSLDAMKHDMDVTITNAINYFAINAELLVKMRRLSDWFTRTLSRVKNS